MKKKSNQIVLIGYVAAMIGVLCWFVTKNVTGLEVGGLMLILTSIYKVSAGKNDRLK